MENEENHNGFWLGIVVGGLAVADEKDKKKLIAKGKEILESLEDFSKEAAEKGGELGKAVLEKVEELPEKIEPVVKKISKPSKRFFWRKKK